MNPEPSPSGRSDLLYILQQIILPEAVFSMHPMLVENIKAKKPMPLLHFASKALIQCIRLGFITGEPDSEENRALLAEFCKTGPVRTEVENGHFIYVFTMPKPEQVTEAFFVGITQRIHNPDNDPLRYFLLEKSAGEMPHLCEKTAAGAHLNHGEIESSRIYSFIVEIGMRLPSSD